MAVLAASGRDVLTPRYAVMPPAAATRRLKCHEWTLVTRARHTKKDGVHETAGAVDPYESPAARRVDDEAAPRAHGQPGEEHVTAPDGPSRAHPELA